MYTIYIVTKTLATNTCGYVQYRREYETKEDTEYDVSF